MSKSDDQRRGGLPGWGVLVALVAALIALILKLLRKRPPTVVHYPGLTVTVPTQNRPVQVVERPLPPLEELNSPDDEFKPGRLIVNFEVLDAERPDTPLTFFDPPITIESPYTLAQVEQAQREAETFRAYTRGETNIAMPLLGFWDGHHWVLFRAGKNQVIYRPNEDPKTGGVIIAKVARWADPPVGAWP